MQRLAQFTTQLHRNGWLQPVLVGALAFGLYAITAAPSIAFLYDDSLEFQLVGPTFGIAHPTGYPLYTLLSGLWARLLFPFGNWAWRMNLFSALAGAVTVALLFSLTRRLTRYNSMAALAAAAAFALSPLWWQQATLAEVYTLHALFVVAILYTSIRIADNSATVVHRLPILLILIGVALTHHRTTLLLVPGVALYLAYKQPSLLRPQRSWLAWIGMLTLPLLLYAYLPLRAAMGIGDLEGDYVNTWHGFWAHVLASGYSGFLTDNPLAVDHSAGDWLSLFVAQFGWIGLILIVIGLGRALLDREQWPAWALIIVTVLINLGFAINYRVGDAEVFALPAVLSLSILIGGAVNGLQRWHGIGLLALALIVIYPVGRGAPVNRAADWAVHDYAVEMAKVDFPAQSRVVGLRGQMTALAYMQAAEGLGRAATPVAIDDAAARRAYVEDAVAAGLPLYLTQEVEGIGARYSFSGEGPLVRVWPRGAAQPGSPSILLAQDLAGGSLRLLGYDLNVANQASGPALQLALYWQATEPLTRTLKLSFRLLNADGVQLGQEDRFPLRQVAMTSDWLPTEVVRDVHDLPLLTGTHRILVIVYAAESVEEVGRVEIPLP